MDPTPYREVLKLLPLCAYMTDADGWITYFNDAAVDLCGRVPRVGRDRWCVTWRLYWPDGRPMPHAECPMAAALKEGRAVRGAEAIAERPNGTRFRFTPYPTPFRDAEGAVAGGMNVLINRSEHATLASLRETFERDQALKVDAMLDLIRTVVSETLSPRRNSGLRASLQRINQSIDAIALAHGLFRAAEADASIVAWDLLSSASILAGAGLGSGVQIRCVAGTSDVPADRALPLALLIRELVLSIARTGSAVDLEISLGKHGNEYILVVDGAAWADNTTEVSAGYPSSLAAVLARQLDGRIEITTTDPQRLVLRFPDSRTYN